MKILQQKQLFRAIISSSIRLAEDWRLLKDISRPYRSYNINNITAFFDLPFDFRTLVMGDQTIEIANRTPLKFLKEYCLMHGFFHPELKTLSYSDGRVSPILPEFALFQLSDAIWLNPLTIPHLHKQVSSWWIRLANGLELKVVFSEEAVIQLAIRQLKGTRKLSPVDYLRVPAVYFGARLQDAFLLSQWLSSPGNHLSSFPLECPWELARQKSSSALLRV